MNDSLTLSLAPPWVWLVYKKSWDLVLDWLPWNQMHRLMSFLSEAQKEGSVIQSKRSQQYWTWTLGGGACWAANFTQSQLLSATRLHVCFLITVCAETKKGWCCCFPLAILLWACTPAGNNVSFKKKQLQRDFWLEVSPDSELDTFPHRCKACDYYSFFLCYLFLLCYALTCSAPPHPLSLTHIHTNTQNCKWVTSRYLVCLMMWLQPVASLVWTAVERRPNSPHHPPPPPSPPPPLSLSPSVAHGNHRQILCFPQRKPCNPHKPTGGHVWNVCACVQGGN